MENNLCLMYFFSIKIQISNDACLFYLKTNRSYLSEWSIFHSGVCRSTRLRHSHGFVATARRFKTHGLIVTHSARNVHIFRGAQRSRAHLNGWWPLYLWHIELRGTGHSVTVAIGKVRCLAFHWRHHKVRVLSYRLFSSFLTSNSWFDGANRNISIKFDWLGQLFQYIWVVSRFRDSKKLLGPTLIPW